MSKISALQSSLEKATGRVRRVEEREETPVAQPAAPAAEQAKPMSASARSRAGRAHIGGYFPTDFKRSLRLVQAQTGDNTETLLRKAMNELFRAHNVPVVDDE